MSLLFPFPVLQLVGQRLREYASLLPVLVDLHQLLVILLLLVLVVDDVVGLVLFVVDAVLFLVIIVSAAACCIFLVRTKNFDL